MPNNLHSFVSAFTLNSIGMNQREWYMMRNFPKKQKHIHIADFKPLIIMQWYSFYCYYTYTLIQIQIHLYVYNYVYKFYWILTEHTHFTNIFLVIEHRICVINVQNAFSLVFTFLYLLDCMCLWSHRVSPKI